MTIRSHSKSRSHNKSKRAAADAVHRPTIGILYPGSAGAALGGLLVADGVPVVTTLEGRSPSTRRRCVAAGLDALASIEEVARAADIVISVVPPDAAVPVAERFASIDCATHQLPVYVDANAISPSTMRSIDGLLAERGVAVVDAAIHGLAATLSDRGVVYLSGPLAPTVEPHLRRSVATHTLSDEVGTASTLRMLLSGLSKGVFALFAEMGSAAHRADLLEPYLERCFALYPGILDIVDRLSAAYLSDAARRSQEMRQLEDTMRSLGFETGLAEAFHGLFTEMAKHQNGGGAGDRDRVSLQNLLELVSAARRQRSLPPKGDRR